MAQTRMPHQTCESYDRVTALEHPLVKSDPVWRVPRTGAALSFAMAPLLRTARRILLVDPFFDIRKPADKETLKSCLDVVANAGGVPPGFEIHFRDHDSRPPTWLIERDARVWLAGVLPQGIAITLFGWKERPGGEDFHARDLLTDFGGLNAESGFSAEGGNQTVRITLLSDAETQLGLATFDRGAMVFELVEPVLKINSGGSVERLA